MVRTLCFFFVPVKFTVTALIQEVNSRGRLEFIFTMNLLLKDQGMSFLTGKTTGISPTVESGATGITILL